jgi:hypothetical protein
MDNDEERPISVNQKQTVKLNLLNMFQVILFWIKRGVMV